MKKILFYVLVLFTAVSYSQNTLSKLLKKYNTEAIPYISVEELSNAQKRLCSFRYPRIQRI